MVRPLGVGLVFPGRSYQRFQKNSGLRVINVTRRGYFEQITGARMI